MAIPLGLVINQCSFPSTDTTNLAFRIREEFRMGFEGCGVGDFATTDGVATGPALATGSGSSVAVSLTESATAFPFEGASVTSDGVSSGPALDIMKEATIPRARTAPIELPMINPQLVFAPELFRFPAVDFRRGA
jgi:hypothetical protein